MRHRLKRWLPAGLTPWTALCVLIAIGYVCLLIWAAIAVTLITLRH